MALLAICYIYYLEVRSIVFVLIHAFSEQFFSRWFVVLLPNLSSIWRSSNATKIFGFRNVPFWDKYLDTLLCFFFHHLCWLMHPAMIRHCVILIKIIPIWHCWAIIFGMHIFSTKRSTIATVFFSPPLIHLILWDFSSAYDFRPTDCSLTFYNFISGAATCYVCYIAIVFATHFSIQWTSINHFIVQSIKKN